MREFVSARRRHQPFADGLPCTCEALEPRVCLSSVYKPEFMINTMTTGDQQVASVAATAADADGNSVTVWQSYGQDALLTWGIYAQRHDAAGNPAGPEFLVNTGYLLDHQMNPSVAMNADGSFVVAWDGAGLLGLFPGIYVQRYAADGTPVGSAIGVAGSAVLDVSKPQVGVDAAGNFVVAFEANDELFSRGVYVRRYSAAGTALAAAALANPSSSGAQTTPALAVRPDGSFVVAWEGSGTGDASGVFARTYSATGVAAAGEVRLNQTTASTQSDVALAASTGGFLAAWSGNGSGDSSGVFLRSFDAAGAALTGEQRVNTTTTGAQTQPSVARGPQGSVVVVWGGEGTGDSAGVFLQELASDLSARGSERRLNSTTAGVQQRAAVAAGSENQYVVTWAGAGAGDSDGVFGAVFVNEAPTVTASGGSASFTEDGGSVAVDAGATVGDADSTTLSSATIVISAGYAAGEDALQFTDQLGITGSWSAVTGTLTLTGVATVATYQAALRSIAYANSSQNPTTAGRSITFRVSDGMDLSAAAVRSLAVTAVNDAPVATATVGSASFVEDAGPIVVDGSITVSDVDSTLLSWATVAISLGYASGQDELQFTDQAGITGSWSAVTGVLTLTGSATLAAYQAAIRTVRYHNTSQNPSTAARAVTFVVYDGAAASADASRSLAVSGVNDAPVVTASGGTAAFTEDGPAVAVDPGIAILDVDSASITSATVAISGGYVAGEDELLFSSQSGISGTWDQSTGTLTLTGVATVAAYQAALRTITYNNSVQNPTTAARTVAFTVSDGVDASASTSRVVTVTAINDAPVVTASAGSAAFTEDGSGIVIDPGITIVDVDSASVASATMVISGGYVAGEDELLFSSQSGISGTWDQSTGTLTLTGVATVAAYQAALRTITYNNSAQNPTTAARTVAFTVSDGVDASAAASRGISITASNDAPVVTTSAGTATFTEDGSAVAVDPGITISDVDSAVLMAAAISISAGFVAGQDVLHSAGRPGVSVSWDGVTGVLTLTGAATVAEYQDLLRAVTYTNSSQQPVVAARTVAFTVSDGVDASASTSRVVTVTAVNDAPVATASSGAAAFTEDGPAVAADPGIVVSDVDSPMLAWAMVRIVAGYAPGEDVLLFVDQLGIAGSWDAISGTLTLIGAATVADYQTALAAVMYSNSSQNPSTAARSIAFAIHDGVDVSALASRGLTVAAVNDAPVATASVGTAAFTEDGAPVEIDPGFGLSDVDSTLVVSATVSISAGYVSAEDELIVVDQGGITGSWNAVSGVLTLTGAASIADYRAAIRSVVYRNTSQNPSVALRTIAVRVSDGVDQSAVVSRSLAVTAVNDAPVATASGGTAAFTEDGPAVLIDPGVLVHDVDSASLASATVSITAGYVSGEDLLLFTDQAGIAGSWDAVSGVLTLLGAASVADYQTALRSITYRNLSQSPSTASRTVSVRAYDGVDLSGSTGRALSVTAVNDAPVVTSTAGAAVFTEDGPAVLIDAGLLVQDVDSASIASATVSISAGYALGEDALLFIDQAGIAGSWDAVAGMLTLVGVASVADYQAALRSVTFQNISQHPSAAPRMLSITVDDGSDQGGAARSLTVTPVDDAPVLVASGGSATYTEDGPAAVIDPGALVSDVDSGSLSWITITITGGYAASQDQLHFTDQLGITGSWDAVAGRLTLTGAAPIADYEAALRSVSYVNTSQNPSVAVRTLSFVAASGALQSAAATRALVVVAVNDAPVGFMSAGTIAYVEDASAVHIDSGLTVTDVDSALLVSAIVAISGYVSGEDELHFTAQAGITGIWNPASGELTLSGAAAVSLYETALRSVTYRNVSASPSTTPRVVAVTLSDGVDVGFMARMLSVSSVNDAPTVMVSSGVAVFTEDGIPIPMDAGLTISDPDSTMLAGATVVIAAGYAAGEDVLSVVDQLGIVGSWDASSGVLTLAGPASVADYETVLRSVTFRNTSQSPSPGPRTVVMSVNDGIDSSASAQRMLSVVAVNDAPSITTSAAGVLYTEGAGERDIDAGVAVADVDSALLSWATVEIDIGYVAGQDALRIPLLAGISGSWDAASGVLTLSGSATIAQYQAALRAVTYINTSRAPVVQSRGIAIVASDGLHQSAVSRIMLSIAAVNDAPEITPSGASVVFTEDGEDAALDPGLLIADVDSSVITSAAVTMLSGYAAGEDQLLFAARAGIDGRWDADAGALFFTGNAPASEYQAILRSVVFRSVSQHPSTSARVFVITVSDGVDQGASAAMSIAVSAVNDAPVVSSSSPTAEVTWTGGTVPIDPGLLVQDADSPTLAWASISISSGYVPGEDELRYASPSGITGSWDPATGTLLLTGPASPAEYQAAIRSVVYTASVTDPASRSRGFSVIAGDALAPSASTTWSLLMAVAGTVPPPPGPGDPEPDSEEPNNPNPPQVEGEDPPSGDPAPDGEPPGGVPTDGPPAAEEEDPETQTAAGLPPRVREPDDAGPPEGAAPDPQSPLTAPGPGAGPETGPSALPEISAPAMPATSQTPATPPAAGQQPPPGTPDPIADGRAETITQKDGDGGRGAPNVEPSGERFVEPSVAAPTPVVAEAAAAALSTAASSASIVIVGGASGEVPAPWSSAVAAAGKEFAADLAKLRRSRMVVVGVSCLAATSFISLAWVPLSLISLRWGWQASVNLGTLDLVVYLRIWERSRQREVRPRPCEAAQ